MLLSSMPPLSRLSPVPVRLPLLIENVPQSTPPSTFAASPDPLLSLFDPSSVSVDYAHGSLVSLILSQTLRYFVDPRFTSLGCFLEFPVHVHMSDAPHAAAWVHAGCRHCTPTVHISTLVVSHFARSRAPTHLSCLHRVSIFLSLLTIRAFDDLAPKCITVQNCDG